jgi:hypothetical protein
MLSWKRTCWQAANGEQAGCHRMLKDARFWPGVTIPEVILQIERRERRAGILQIRFKTLLRV